MERSLINEFKGSNSTLFHSTVLGTTSLLQRPKETDLYKSRIAHLPSDSKTDLSRKLDFVVVFQAIEIERLAQELAGLKGRLRETEGRGLHQASYEVQIRELMDRCSKLESEKYSYRQELAQTKAASESIFHELSLLQGRYSEVDFCAAEKYKLEKARGEELVLQIEKWKGRYTALERAKIEEQQGLRRMMEAQKEAFGKWEMKDLMGRFQLEKEELLMRLRERKEQLDEKELEMKKLQNCFEQLQVRSREDEAKIDSYEQKVAMLSQQTFRLNQLVRAKSQQIRNLKLINQQDFSLKMSQINSLDQTRHQLNNRLQILQDENDQLRDEGKALMQQNAHMKRKLVQVDRLEFQLRQAREDCENKLKSMERKDKKIIALEEQMKNSKKLQQQVKKMKDSNVKLQTELQNLQQNLDSKINQLRQIKEQQTSFISWRDEFNNKVHIKLNQFTNGYQALQRQNSEIRAASQKNLEKSTTFELKAKQFALQLKQKDYIISSLQNQIRQQEAKLNTKEVQANNNIQQLESHLFTQRRNFQIRLQEAQGRRRQGEQIIRQAQARARQAEKKVRDSQNYQTRVRSLEAECRDLESWGRSLQSKNHQLQMHITELQAHLLQLEDQRAEWRGIIQGQSAFYRQVQARYFQNAQELKTLKARLDNIEKILITLKSTVGLRLKNAHEQDRRLHAMQQRYQQLFQWFVSASANFESGLKDSPTKQPYNGLFGNYGSNQSSRYSTSIDRSSLSPLHRARSSQRTRENINSGNHREQQPSIEAAIRHVLLCAQVQSLRKRVGDKNAKVQSMRNSIVAKGYSQPSGFFTARETSVGKKTIYY